tara:strand:- start:1739 stop:2026 length:288 start_codon:yes stop_codon:yes gene_type:complete
MQSLLLNLSLACQESFLMIQEAPQGFIISGAIFGLVVLLAIVPLAFWVWMGIDCLGNEALTGTERILWILAMLFFPVLGSIIYFFGGRDPRPTAV